MCAVYIVIAGDYAAAKIGKANDPKGRLSELQVGNHEALRLLRVFEGSEAEESALHLRFAHLHKRGDWFAFSREMLGDVDLVEIRIEEPPQAPDPIVTPDNENDIGAASVAAIRSRRGCCAAIARALDISKGAVSMWKRVPADKAVAVERITGIPLHVLRPDIFPPSGASA